VDVIICVEKIKYLGLVIDETLSWKFHIMQLKNQLRNTVRKFYFLRRYVTDQMLNTLYYALVHSRLVYGIELFGGANKSVLHPLEIVQKHYIRLLSYKARREPSFPLFKQLNILPLKHLFVYKVLRVFYIRSGNIGLTRSNYFTRGVAHRLLLRPKVNKTIFRNCFVFLGPKIFNNLPTYIKECKGFPKFQFKVKNWLFQIPQISTIIEILQ